MTTGFQLTPRVRRSAYRRRLRLRRAFAAVVLTTLVVGVCWENAARYISLPTVHVFQALPRSFQKVNIHKERRPAVGR